MKLPQWEAAVEHTAPPPRQEQAKITPNVGVTIQFGDCGFGSLSVFVSELRCNTSYHRWPSKGCTDSYTYRKVILPWLVREVEAALPILRAMAEEVEGEKDAVQA